MANEVVVPRAPCLEPKNLNRYRSRYCCCCYYYYIFLPRLLFSFPWSCYLRRRHTLVCSTKSMTNFGGEVKTPGSYYSRLFHLSRDPFLQNQPMRSFSPPLLPQTLPFPPVSPRAKPRRKVILTVSLASPKPSSLRVNRSP